MLDSGPDCSESDRRLQAANVRQDNCAGYLGFVEVRVKLSTEQTRLGTVLVPDLCRRCSKDSLDGRDHSHLRYGLRAVDPHPRSRDNTQRSPAQFDRLTAS